MTFLVSALLTLWLARACFEIAMGFLNILLGLVALLLGGALYALAVIAEIFVRILRTAFSSCN